MKTRHFISVAIAATISLIGFAAQAAGIDLSHVFAMSPEMGIGLASCMGSIEVITKSMDRIQGGIESIKGAQAELSERVLYLEQRGTPGASGMDRPQTKSIGLQIAEGFTANADLFSKTRSVRLEVKAATDPITTTNGRTVATGGVGAIIGGMIGIHNAMPMRGAQGSSVEYSRLTTQEGAAAVQAAEGDKKAAVRPVHELINQPAITVAGYTKMSKQSLTDSQELANAVNLTLARSVNTALDAVLASGTATVFVGGLNALATEANSAVYTELPDAISEAMAAMQTAGFNPDTVVLSPAEWLAIVVAKSGGDGQYYAPQAYLGQVPMFLRGLRVVLSPSIAAGRAMVLDSTHTELLTVDNFAVEIGYEDDDFTRNLAVLRGEMRVIPVFRTVGAARIVVPMA